MLTAGGAKMCTEGLLTVTRVKWEALFPAYLHHWPFGETTAEVTLTHVACFLLDDYEIFIRGSQSRILYLLELLRKLTVEQLAVLWADEIDAAWQKDAASLDQYDQYKKTRTTVMYAALKDAEARGVDCVAMMLAARLTTTAREAGEGANEVMAGYLARILGGFTARAKP